MNDIPVATFVRESGFHQASGSEISKSGRTNVKMSNTFENEAPILSYGSSENPEIRSVRPNKNKNNNNNNNKNNNTFYQPDLSVRADNMGEERINFKNDDEQKIRISPNPEVVIDIPDTSFESYEQKIRTNPDESRVNKKSGQINENDVIKNPDESEQNDDDKNEPMTAEQIQWLRDRGYTV